ncbi:hypothetical protein V2J09_009212 [Rumex salicifolius]
MDVAQAQTQYLNFGGSMYREGYLDDQFTVLQILADESQPGFVLEIISIFFNDSDRILQDLTQLLDKPVPDFNQVAELVHTLKGSSSSVGAKKVKNVCTTFKKYSEEQNLQGCQMCLQQVKQDYALVRNKLETLLSMQLQIKAAGGEVPLIE